jgi:hypothetical protein
LVRRLRDVDRPRRAFRVCVIGTRVVSHGAIVSGLDRVQPENDTACQRTLHDSSTRDRAPARVAAPRESIFGHVFSATRWTGGPRQRRCFRLGGASQTADGGILVSGTLWIPILLAQGVRLARARLPRLLPWRRSGRPPGPSERPRTTLAYASRAPQANIARLKARMGWEMP